MEKDMREVKVGEVRIGKGQPLVVIAGPCVIESEEMTFRTAESLKEMSVELGIPLIFKSSFDKANRSSLSSFRGPGIKKGLKVLGDVKKRFSVPVTSDVHAVDQVEPAAEVLDLLQIPAFLCRQTDLVSCCIQDRQTGECEEGTVSLSVGGEEHHRKVCLYRKPESPHYGTRIVLWIS